MFGVAKSLELLKYQYLLYKAKRNNQYKVSIFRAAPSFDTETSIKITDTIQEVSIIHDGIEVKETQIGNAILNTHGVKQSGEIRITFLETEDNDVINFLTRHEDGTPIIPTDGTHLLPYDFYFFIEVTHQSSDMRDGLLQKALDLIFDTEDKKSISGEFIIEGNLEQGYVAGEPDWQTITATFKRLKSWGGRVGF
jgi:hypothetical protein